MTQFDDQDRFGFRQVNRVDESVEAEDLSKEIVLKSPAQRLLEGLASDGQEGDVHQQLQELGLDVDSLIEWARSKK